MGGRWHQHEAKTWQYDFHLQTRVLEYHYNVLVLVSGSS